MPWHDDGLEEIAQEVPKEDPDGSPFWYILAVFAVIVILLLVSPAARHEITTLIWWMS